MPLTNTELGYYDSNVLRLPKEKRTEYHAQVDNLILELCAAVRDKTKIKITDVVKAGSFAKHTILRKTSADPVDVDVVFHISGRNVGAETLQGLNDTLFELLVDIYPTKKVRDFELQRKTSKVSFTGTGLSVDIVPVIDDPNRVGFGWQFDLTDGSVIQTCASCQIEFVRNRKKRDKDYRTLVRMGKRWRNQAELDALKSFAIELIVAHLLDTEGANGSIEQRFRRFLLYIAQSELKQPIAFPENGLVRAFPAGEVVILDPVCNSNNVTARITARERVDIVKAATIAWETSAFASTENDHEVWKEIFGPRFKTEDE